MPFNDREFLILRREVPVVATAATAIGPARGPRPASSTAIITFFTIKSYFTISLLKIKRSAALNAALAGLSFENHLNSDTYARPSFVKIPNSKYK
jgi:hypothetical protein